MARDRLTPIWGKPTKFNNVIGLPLPLLMSLIDDVPQLAAAPQSHTRGTSRGTADRNQDL